MTFIPDRIPISNISNANPGVVTTSVSHNLTTGQVVRLHVPKNYGMFQLNQMQVSVQYISNTMFSIFNSLQPPNPVTVNTTNFHAFTTPSNPQFTAEVLPMGSGPTPISSPPVYANNFTCIDPLDDATHNNSTVEIPF
jgi:hypothetical protein